MNYFAKYLAAIVLPVVLLAGPGLVSAAEFDFGDAPEVYPTTLARDGARHESSSLVLGTLIDTEPDALANLTASGDDTESSDNDEDGVSFSTLYTGELGTVTVRVSGGEGYLNAWFDFNADGDWDDVGEQVVSDTRVSPGANQLAVSIPSANQVTRTFARFRLSSAGGDDVTGPAADGEVEDYRVIFQSRNQGSSSFGSGEAFGEGSNSSESNTNRGEAFGNGEAFGDGETFNAGGINVSGSFSNTSSGGSETGIVPDCQGACGFKDFVKLIKNIFDFLVKVAVFGGAFIVMYVGFLYITSGDNASQRGKANTIMTNFVIGFVVMLTAWLIVDIIFDVFVDPSEGNFRQFLGN